jgi:hypothetical protein
MCNKSLKLTSQGNHNRDTEGDTPNSNDSDLYRVQRKSDLSQHSSHNVNVTVGTMSTGIEENCNSLTHDAVRRR